MIKNKYEVNLMIDAENKEDIIMERTDKAEKPAKKPSLQDLPGVGAATAEKLFEAGYSDLMSVAVATPGEVSLLWITSLTSIGYLSRLTTPVRL